MKKKDSIVQKATKATDTDQKDPGKQFSDEELALIDRAEKQCRNSPPKLQASKGKGGSTLEPEGELPQLVSAKLSHAFGTADDSLINLFVRQLHKCFPTGYKQLDSINTGLAIMYGAAPTDELEAMLCLQMVATHNLAMRVIGQAFDTIFPEVASEKVNMATKLLRTYTSQMESLNRNRGKYPGQKVVVEHVHVNDGGQAVVGNVERTPKGRGGNGKN